MKILIVDDQTLMRDGLKIVLNLEDDMEVVGTAANGKEAYEFVKEVQPDVILMDIRMPITNGVEATRIIKEEFENIIIIMLTTFDDEELIVDAIRNGASGYILKETDYTSLIQSIREIYDGKFILPNKIAKKFLNNIFNTQRNMEEGYYDISTLNFTKKDIEVCKLIALGYSNNEIGKKLFLSKGTVKNYVSRIYSKIGVNNRTAAVLFLKNINF
ncbi:response regulator transcription factor [Oceanirhabdus sp. W0125-5]|uniref:response regulator transcription factor n=1 Tax=Oceanirhabdus sp. W0125-5 TaxID=2999116 RepID=UPI0022F334FC|nr:response regulator transcription factor [Oceanirhabdus sp. W0125-5]WBW97292.1 response regulator transcription factor [Oceanirhabdus sp. W0125-5]